MEVIEDEVIDVDETLNQAKQFNLGNISQDQIRQILEKKLKEDRIFGFRDFEEFNSNYFKKELVAFDAFYKMRQLKYARMQYNNRFGDKQNAGSVKAGSSALQPYDMSAMPSILNSNLNYSDNPMNIMAQNS